MDFSQIINVNLMLTSKIYFMKKFYTYLFIYLSTFFVLSAQTPGIPQFDTSGKDYIEYIPGNLPIIISAPHGGVKLTGGTVNGVSYPDNSTTNSSSSPYYLPTRSCGTNERDDNTDVLIRQIQDEIFAQTGGYAHIIINNLNRKKLDPNREINEAACGNTNAEFFWNAWHNFIDQASASVEANFGKGIYIDLHGQSHSVPRIEVGYNISATELNTSDLNTSSIINASTIKNLESDNLNNYNHEELVRGEFSLGQLFQNAPGTFYASNNYPGCTRNGENGYRAVPSNSVYSTTNSACDDTRPYNNSYFDGDYYNNRRHGSGTGTNDGAGGGGTVDGIMTEVNRRVRDLGAPYDNRPNTLSPFAIDYANVLLEFINVHYNNFTAFNYSSNTYDLTDSNPSPTLTGGVTGGQYTSSSSGLVINSATGEIDLSTSQIGDYVITYSIGPIKSGDTNRYYNTIFNIELTDSTLSNSNLETFPFSIYPNPTNNIINFKSSKQISEIKVYNTLGKLVKSFDIKTNEGSIDLSQFSTGMYMTVFYDENQQKAIVKRVMKN